ncbi:MAG: hypothetical protein MUC69_05290 [Gemmatimonadales bacterium]|jgi:hypothetical protein|nr:hypothetical protein [Gemmatimonadales bacterium]
MVKSSPGDLEGLVAAFVQGTLPASAWTHEAHLRVGLWHVRRHGPEAALPLLRARIRAYNEARGTANTPTSGYHETITRFYVWLIAGFLRKAPPDADADALADALIAAHGHRGLPLDYWSDDALFSTAARVGWVPPDVRALEWPDAPAPPPRAAAPNPPTPPAP